MCIVLSRLVVVSCVRFIEGFYLVGVAYLCSGRDGF